MLLVVIGFVLAKPVSARAISLAEAVCTIGADSAEAAFAASPEQLDCGPGRFDNRAPFVRGRVEIAKIGTLPAGQLIWQTAPVGFASMLMRLDHADGTQRLVDIDAQMTVRNWDASGSFWVSIQPSPSPLVAIDVVVERPQSDAVFARMAMAGSEDASLANYTRTLLYVLLCGILLVPVLYDLLFYRILRARFMVWHLAMTVGTLIYTLTNSGLIILLVPDILSFHRFAANYLATSMVMLGSVRFSLLIIEDGKLDRGIRRALNVAVLLNCALALGVCLHVEVLRIRVLTLYLASILPIIILTIIALTMALVRRSRTAIFLGCAYAGLLLTGVAQVAALLNVIPRSDFVDEAIYTALVIMVLGTSAAVGDRFLIIKAERDSARITARKLGAMANSDGLTGLLNRRAFDQTRRLKSGCALLLADIDHFKAINDSFGHQRGDAALIHAARVIENAVANNGGGEVYRLGGEEFAILSMLPEPSGIEGLAEAVRAAVQDGSRGNDGYDLPDMTISVGAVMGRGQLMHVAYSEADGALYAAKESGRNRCRIAEIAIS